MSRYFDPHIHMTSRTTDDYQAMADAGITAIMQETSALDKYVHSCVFRP